MDSTDTTRPKPQRTNIANGGAGDTARLEGDTWTPDEEVIEEGLPPRAGTFRSLAHRDFRYFLIGAVISNVGTWMQMIALGALVVFVLKGTAITVGLVNFASTVPVFFLALPAGVVADRVDRRRLLILLQLPLLVFAVALGYLTQTKMITVPAVMGITFAAGIATALMFPAWQAILLDLVPKRDLMNAVALNSAQFNSARLIGPAIAGIALAKLGYAAVFYINGISFLTVVAALAVVRPKPQARPKTKDGALRLLTEGLRYARHHVCVGVYLLTIALTTLFGFFYIYLLPILARDFKIGPAGLGYLMAASGGGAVLGALFVAQMPRGVRKELIVKTAVLVFASLLILFSLSRSPWLSMVLLVFIGASFMAITSTSNTAIQTLIPGEIRGRIMALFVLSFMGMMPFSSLMAGALGQRLGVRVAIGLGAVVLVAYGLLLTAKPSLLSSCADGESPAA